MATPRRPYVTIPLGEFQAALRSGLSSDAVALFALVWTHPDKRSIPGLLGLGPAGLAESLENVWSPAKTGRLLRELQHGKRVLLDGSARLIYCLGGVESDPPRTENSVRGMANQLRGLPSASPVVRVIRGAIEASLSDQGGKSSAWLPLWRSLVGPESEPEPGPYPSPDSGSDVGRGPGPLPIPPSASAAADPDPIPGPPPQPELAPYVRAWNRLPRPFAAAAAQDFQQAAKAINPGTFSKLVRELAMSGWLNPTKSGLQFVPTLRRLVQDEEYLDRILSGEFVDRDGADPDEWKCPDCAMRHEPIAECPPVPLCGRRHDHEYCTQCRELEYAALRRETTA
jgi:hypothetical protein